MSQSNPTEVEADIFAKTYSTNGHNATEAAIIAFPHSKAKRESMSVKGSMLLKTPQVQECLKLAEIERAEKFDVEYNITLDSQIQKLAQVQARLHEAVMAGRFSAGTAFLQVTREICTLSGFYKEGSGVTIIFQNDYGTPTEKPNLALVEP